MVERVAGRHRDRRAFVDRHAAVADDAGERAQPGDLARRARRRCRSRSGCARRRCSRGRSSICCGSSGAATNQPSVSRPSGVRTPVTCAAAPGRHPLENLGDDRLPLALGAGLVAHDVLEREGVDHEAELGHPERPFRPSAAGSPRAPAGTVRGHESDALDHRGAPPHPRPVPRPDGARVRRTGPLDRLLRDEPHLRTASPSKGACSKRPIAPGRPYGLTVTGDALRVVIGDAHDGGRRRPLHPPLHHGQGLQDPKRSACPDGTGSFLAYDGDRLYLSQRDNQVILELDESGDGAADDPGAAPDHRDGGRGRPLLPRHDGEPRSRRLPALVSGRAQRAARSARAGVDRRSPRAAWASTARSSGRTAAPRTRSSRSPSPIDRTRVNAGHPRSRRSKRDASRDRRSSVRAVLER